MLNPILNDLLIQKKKEKEVQVEKIFSNLVI